MPEFFPGIPRKLMPLFIFMIIAPFAFGLFYDFAAGFASVILFIILIFLQKGEKNIKFNAGFALVLTILPFCHLVCSLWAVDKGAAFLGFIKYLPLLPFTLIMMQLSVDERALLLDSVPIGAAAMTLLSVIFGFIPSLRDSFFDGERLAGFFQYSNTFALYLLFGIVVLCSSKKLTPRRLLASALLIFGIFQSGSRTVFALLFLAIIVLFATHRQKKFRLYLGAMFGAFIVISFLYVGFTANYSAFGRFWTAYLNSATMFARLLYFKDAAGQILSHPFGMGNLGYYYTLREFQSQGYNLMFIHNDFLQMMLDIGWIPAFAFIAGLVYSIAKAPNPTWRLILVLIALHGLFDFSMQYIIIMLVICLLFDYSKGKTFEIAPDTAIAHALCLVFCCLGLYFGTARLLGYTGHAGASLEMYSKQTDIKSSILAATNNVENMDNLADDLLKDNRHLPIAYGAKALYAYSKGDFSSVMDYEDKAISLAPYDSDEYQNYCEMLIVGISLYEQQGDTVSSQLCKNKLLALVKKVEELNRKKNRLAEKAGINTPVELSEGVLQYAQSLANN